MNEEVFGKISENCPARLYNNCQALQWTACRHSKCHVAYLIEAISKHTLNNGYEVKDFLNDNKD